MIIELVFPLLLLLHPDAQICNATVFAQHGDRWAGGKSRWLRREVRPTDVGVAHRRHPLGSWVEITNIRNGKTTKARVIDRGPFGRVGKDGRWYNGVEHFRSARRQGKPIPRTGWRGCLDMTPKVARRIGLNGFEPVLVRLLPPSPKQKRKRKHATSRTRS